MHSKPAFWRRTLVPALFLFVLAALFLALRFRGNPPQAEVGATVEIKRPQPSPVPMIDDRKIEAAAKSLPDDFVFPGKLLLNDSGRNQSFVLALDEISIKDADGKDHLRPISPSATLETYATRIRDFESEGRVLPVLYPDGEERTPYNRRLVTSSVLVEATDNADRSSLPLALRLPTEMVPAASPKHIVVTAPSPLAAIAGLDIWRAIPNVKSVEVLLAKQQSKRAMPNDTLIANQWHLKYQGKANTVAGTDVNVESVWNYPSTTPGTFIRGAGVFIGVVDDGLQTNHPDLMANVDTTIDKDWNGNDADPSPGTEDFHGTACAGNAAGVGNNGIGVSGTAPEAKLVGMRLISDPATDAQEAEAMGYQPDVIQIKTNSWGPDDGGKTVEGPGTLTKAALKQAATAGRNGRGTIFTWACGNGGDAGDNSNYDGYANSIYTIAIGGTDSLGNRAYYSEPGANVLVCTPTGGDSPSLNITTVDRTGSSGYNTGSTEDELADANYTQQFNGTSSSTPTAAGIIALILEKNPNLGWRDVQEILIRSAKKFKPADSDWVNNSAGFHFNHNFGAGLIDAAAAVTLANGWTNLPAQTSTVVTQSTGLPATILNNTPAGITTNFVVTPNLRVEQVTVRVNINHTSRGDLAVTLTSPTGMVSKLTEVHNDTGDNFSDWTFSTVRSWGEASNGTWTLKIADNAIGSGRTANGTLTAAELTVFGTPGVPVNPAPVVQITSPATGATFSPSATVPVTVSASDTVIGGGAGVVGSVQLLDNGNVVGTKTSAPYTFSITPALGSHSLVARATDSEGAAADSAAVTITLVNQAPVITAATIGDAYAYDDTPVTVSGLAASDPDGTTPTISYQWQSSPNGVSFTDVSSLTTATLPADASRSGLKWRCAITATDGVATSDVFYTNAVNLLDRPVTSATAGSAYTYQSGLVLRSGGGGATRDAIINEFSQGPASGVGEWVEILVLRQAGFRNWSITDSSKTNSVVFKDAAVWDNIPAGTRIVVYNSAQKDPLIPADDSNAADGSLILSSANPDYFAASAWPSFSNGGDSVNLLNGSGTAVAQISYGTDLSATPRIGAVGGSKSAFYAGGSDEGAAVADNWTVTTSLTSRSPRNQRALGDLFFSEYVEGSGNNKAIEIYNPSSGSVSLAESAYKLEIHANGNASPTTTITLTGTIAAGATYVIANTGASSTLLALANQTGSLGYNGDDALTLKKGSVVVDRIGQVGFDPGTAWVGGSVTTLDRTLRRKAAVLKGDETTGVFNPATEWEVFPVDTFTGLGSHTVGSADPSFFLTISPNTFSESAGAGIATGTITLASAPTANRVVSLASSDLSEATVPASVTISAGQTSATFPVAAVDDTDADGSQSVTLTATAAGYNAATFVVTITDDEVAVEGVTPGRANNAANATWIATLQAGTAGNPALFRLATGSSLPAGLALDAETGLISGSIDPSASGSFSVVIERYNSTGETVSQSFTLAISAGEAVSYATWIAGFPGISNATTSGDPDGDGLSNLMEYYLGLTPNSRDTNSIVMSRDGNLLSLTYPRSLTSTGVTGQVEWSDTLAAGSWSTAGLTSQTTPQTASAQLVKTSLTVSLSEPKKFLRLRVTTP